MDDPEVVVTTGPTEMRLAGSFRLAARGQPPTAAPARQTQLALAYLLLGRAGPIPRDELAEVLWGEQLPRTWETALRGVVARARTTLAAVSTTDAPSIATVDGCYHVQAPTLVVDVEDAIEKLQAAEHAFAVGDLRSACDHAEHVLATTSHRLLPGVENMWVEQWQRRLDTAHRRALAIAAQAALGEGDASRGLEYATHLIDLDELHEPAFQIAIEAHLRSGNRVEAGRAYDRLCAALHDELGVEPTVATTALLDRPFAQPATGSRSDVLPFPEPVAEFVGRGAELAALDECTRPEGRPRRVALVGGEAGIGKSRLAHEFARRRHEAGDRILYGRCAEQPLIPYQPVAEALVRVLDDLDDAALDDLVGVHRTDLSRVMPQLSDRLDAEPVRGDEGTTRYLAFQAVARVLRQLTDQQPVVMVVDDAHWADEGTGALLRVILDAGIPDLIVVATFRDTDAEPPPWEALHTELGRSDAVEVHLQGLDREAIAELLESWAGHPGVPTLASELRDATGGNPFLVQELLRDLVESGDVSLEAGLAAVPDFAQRELPRRARDVVLRRVQALGPDALDVLGTAAIIGATFDHVLLEATCGASAALDVTSRALRARLLREDHETPGRLHFAHSLVRQAVLDELSTAERAARHRQVGEAIEALWGDDRQTVRMMALHFCAALLVGDDGTRAVTLAKRAGDDARTVLAYEDAGDLYQSALDAISRARGDDPSLRAELLLSLGLCQYGYGWIDAARASAEAAYETAERADAVTTMGLAAILYSDAGMGEARATGDLKAAAMLERSLAVLDEQSPLALRARLQARLTFELPPTVDQWAQRDALSLEALDHAREADDKRTLCETLMMRHYVLLGLPRLAERAALTDEALAAARSIGHAELESLALADQAGDRTQAGQLEAAEALIDEYDAIRARLGHTFTRWGTLVWRGALALAEARLDDAEGFMAAAIEAIPASWARFATRRTGALLLALRRAQGRVDEVAPLALATSVERPAPSWAAVVVLAALEVGDEDRARRDLATLFEHLPDEWAITEARQPALCCVAEVVWPLRDAETASLVVEALRPFRSDWVVSDQLCAVIMGAASRYLGLAVAAMGDLDEGEHLLRDSLDEHRKAGATLWALYNQLDLAEVLTARDGRTARSEAKDLAARTLDEANSAGAHGLLPRATALL